MFTSAAITNGPNMRWLDRDSSFLTPVTVQVGQIRSAGRSLPRGLSGTQADDDGSVVFNTRLWVATFLAKVQGQRLRGGLRTSLVLHVSLVLHTPLSCWGHTSLLGRLKQSFKGGQPPPSFHSYHSGRDCSGKLVSITVTKKGSERIQPKLWVVFTSRLMGFWMV